MMAALFSARATADAPLKVTSRELTGSDKVAKEKRKRTESQGSTSTPGLTDLITGDMEAKGTADAKRIKMELDTTYTGETVLHPEQITNNDNEEASRLRTHLTPAEKEVKALTSALEQAYRVTELVRTHMIDGAVRMKTVAGQQDIDTEVKKEILAIAKDSTKTYLKMAVGVDEVSKELGKTFPATADRVFLPKQKRVQTLNEWILAHDAKIDRLVDAQYPPATFWADFLGSQRNAQDLQQSPGQMPPPARLLSEREETSSAAQGQSSSPDQTSSSTQSSLAAQNPSMIPNTVRPLPASVAAPPTRFARFEFPKTRGVAGKILKKGVNMRQLRIELCRQASLPWDTPLFAEEFKAIRRWEVKTGLNFEPGTGMAVWDAGYEGVV